MKNRNSVIKIFYTAIKTTAFMLMYFFLSFFINTKNFLDIKVLLLYFVFAIFIFLFCSIIGFFVWLSISYTIGEDFIEIKRNIIFYEHTKKILFKDVSIFDTSQNLFDKLFKVSSLSIDSSSSMTAKKADLILHLKVEKIDILRQKIEHYKNENKIEASTVNNLASKLDSEESKTDTNNIYKINKKDFILNVIIMLFNPLQLFNIFIILPSVFFEEVSIIMIFYLLFVLVIPLVRTINNLYNYTIKIEEEQILIKYGLYSKKVGNIKISTIKSIKVTNARIFKRSNLEAQVVGSVGAQSNEELGTVFDRIMVYLNPNIIKEIKNKLIIETNSDFKEQISIPIKSIFLDIFLHIYRLIFIFIILSCYKLFYFENLNQVFSIEINLFIKMLFGIVLFILAVNIYFSFIYYRYCKLDIYNNKVHIKKGNFLKSDQMIKIEDIQDIRIKSNIFQRAFCIVKVIITPFKTTAYKNNIQIRNINKNDADKLVKSYLEFERNKSEIKS